MENLISSLKLLVFKPNFSINTGWAYNTMRESGNAYIPEQDAEGVLASWIKNPALENLPLVNNMQVPAFEKFPALEAVLNFIRKEYSLPCLMSGSGSACFAVVNNLKPDALQSLKDAIKKRLGETCFITEA